jgi:LacI family transcriptional regulator
MRVGQTMLVTLAQIARRAGVSAAAVSKALRGQTDIAPATRERIARIAARMGYTVNAAARTLATRKTLTLGVVVAFPRVPTVVERLRGTQVAAAERGYVLAIAFHDGTIEDEIRQIGSLRGRVDGLIITPANQSRELVAALRAAKAPVVLMSESLKGIDCDMVGDDDCIGGALAAQHLVAQGRTRIAYLGQSPTTPSDLQVLTGIRDVLRGRGVTMDRRLVRWQNLTEQATAQNVDWLFDSVPAPTAIVAFSDMAALWAMKRLDARGVRIPDEIALVGYDDTEFATLARVPLTSIAQPNFETGHHAAHLLIDRLEATSRPVQSRRAIFTPQLVARASTAVGSG